MLLLLRHFWWCALTHWNGGRRKSGVLGRTWRTCEPGRIPEAGRTVAAGLLLPSFELLFLHFQFWWMLLPFVQSPELELCETTWKKLGREECKSQQMIDSIQS